MAIYNEILTARFAKAVTKLFSMKGENPTKQLSGEIMAVHVFASGVENRFHEGWDRFGMFFSVAGVAAQTAAARIRNPLGSGIIAVVEKAACSSGTSDAPKLQLAATNADLTTGVASGRLDNRQIRAQGTLIPSNSGTGVGLATTIASTAFPANGNSDFIIFENQEITVLPGDALQIISGVVNQSLNITFFWRERNLEDAEKFG